MCPCWKKKDNYVLCVLHQLITIISGNKACNDLGMSTQCGYLCSMKECSCKVFFSSNILFWLKKKKNPAGYIRSITYHGSRTIIAYTGQHRVSVNQLYNVQISLQLFKSGRVLVNLREQSKCSERPPPPPNPQLKTSVKINGTENKANVKAVKTAVFPASTYTCLCCQ